METEEFKDATVIFTEEQLSAMGEAVKGGAFYEVLKQNSKQIKETKASALAEDLEFSAKNEIIGLKNQLRLAYNQRTEMLEGFLPSSTTSLEIGKGFNGVDFIKKYNTLGLQIRNISIQLSVALESYKFLIGKEFLR